MMPYDAWKTRSDLDEQLPDSEEEREPEECPTCGGFDGEHDRACPDRDVADPLGDYLEEVRHV